jgi:hypothetical protein
MSKEAKLQLVKEERQWCNDEMAKIKQAILTKSRPLAECRIWLDMIIVQLDAIDALEKRALAEKSKRVD